jgi:hypothetical protein
MPNNTLDVIVRFHAPNRIAELERCLLSIVCQEYQPVTIHIVTQRFTACDVDLVEGCARLYQRLGMRVDIRVHNFTAESPKDARSALLNLGIQNAHGKYLAFLDYDDVIYPEGYRLLINELQDSGCSIAFGGVTAKLAEVCYDALLVHRKFSPWTGSNLVDLFRQNHCPIHSFVIDRSQVTNSDIVFSEHLTHGEDYDLLLRLCAKYRSSFALKRKIIADYYMKNDGSNTILLASNDSEHLRNVWAVAEDSIEAQRRSIRLTVDVQRSVGLSTLEPCTIRQALDFLSRALMTTDKPSAWPEPSRVTGEPAPLGGAGSMPT